MFRKLFAGAATAALLLSFITPVQAQQAVTDPNVGGKPAQTQGTQRPEKDFATLMKESDQAEAEENWVRFYVANMRLHEMRPFEPEYLYNVVRACGRLDRKTTAYHYMLMMQKQGLSYDFNEIEDTQNIRGTEAYDYINDLLVQAGAAAGTGTVLFTLPGDPIDFQAIAWDDSRSRFLVGTMEKGILYAVSPDGETEQLLQADDENGLWSITGLAVDVDRNRLWLSSSATPLFAGLTPTDRNRGSLFEFKLDTMEQVGRINLPVDGLAHELGSMAITSDGHLYVIDRTTPIIYRKTPDGDRLEAFFGSRELVALRDIAVTPDNSRIFVSDIAMGVLTIDPVAQQAALVSGPENLNLGGLAGIEYRDGQLFVVQSRIQPQRVTRLALDPSGAQVIEVTPMASALPEFDGPGFTAISDDRLFYFANTGSQDRQAGAAVMATPLDAGIVSAPPDMDMFQEAIRAAAEKQ